MPANKIKVDNAVLKRYARQSARRRQRVVSLRILIVCEGERTEPRYFDSFKKKHNGLFVLDMDVLGLGANTLSVVNKAIELKTKAESVGIPYDSVWAVFDRDSFSEAKFNAAVQKAESHGVNAAWSNEAFELWYLLHFQDASGGALRRSQYCERLSQWLNRPYKKNDHALFQLLEGHMVGAIQRADSLLAKYDHTTIPYSQRNPATNVVTLVKELLRYRQ